MMKIEQSPIKEISCKRKNPRQTCNPQYHETEAGRQLEALHFFPPGVGGTGCTLIMLVSSRKAMRASKSADCNMRSSAEVRFPRVFSARIPSRSMEARAPTMSTRGLWPSSVPAPICSMAVKYSCCTRCSNPTCGGGPAAGFCARIRSSRRCAEASYAVFCSRLSSGVGGGGSSSASFGSAAGCADSVVSGGASFTTRRGPGAGAPGVAAGGGGAGCGGWPPSFSSSAFILRRSITSNFGFSLIALSFSS
jgi:hypothetical protein